MAVDMNEIEDRWTKIAQKQLEGRKIVKVRYLSDKEQESLGWYKRCVVMQLDDGNLIFPSSDDEGNEAGSLFTNDKTNPTLPVL